MPAAARRRSPFCFFSFDVCDPLVAGSLGELLDAVLDRSGQEVNIGRGIVSRTERVADLFIAQSCQEGGQPPRVGDPKMLHPAAILAVEYDPDAVLFEIDLFDEFRPGIIGWFIPAAADPPEKRERITTRFAKADTQIADDVLPFASFFED